MTKAGVALLGFGQWGRNLARNFSQLSQAEILRIDGLDFDRAARSLLKLLEVGEHPQVLYDASA